MGAGGGGGGCRREFVLLVFTVRVSCECPVVYCSLRIKSKADQYARELQTIIILKMEICKAPTLRLKALNRHSISHIMYIERECYQQ